VHIPQSEQIVQIAIVHIAAAAAAVAGGGGGGGGGGRRGRRRRRWLKQFPKETYEAKHTRTPFRSEA